ncbi:hypothetical protein [Flavobacterium sp. RSSB_23]|jgi:putative effector of murein hydrolase|uniref:hypothetical protein n=1 Tax=Flavobacterium sp. RSSB_23 TaxID=3447668 RepID=UPI003F341364
MKYFISQTIQNILIIVFFFIVLNIFRDQKNNTLYKLLDLEHILLIIVFSVAKATYNTYKKKKQ